MTADTGNTMSQHAEAAGWLLERPGRCRTAPSPSLSGGHMLEPGHRSYEHPATGEGSRNCQHVLLVCPN